MSAINVALATRNNILVYMRKVMRPVKQAEILEHCDLPKGVSNKQLIAGVDRAFRTLVGSGEVVRMKVVAPESTFDAKYTYRLAGPLDPTPKAIRAYKPRGMGDRAKAKTASLQAEANAIAEQIKVKQVEEKQRDDRGASVERRRVTGAGEMISVGQVNTLAGVNVEVTSSGLTITLGKITVTIKAD